MELHMKAIEHHKSWAGAPTLTWGGSTGRFALTKSARVLSKMLCSIQPSRFDMSAAMTMPAATASPCSQMPAAPKPLPAQHYCRLLNLRHITRRLLNLRHAARHMQPQNPFLLDTTAFA